MASEAEVPTWFARATRVGFFAKGVLYIVLGVVVVGLATGSRQGDAEASQTGAMRALADQPFGAVVLLLLAAGLALYGVLRLSVAWRSPEADDPGVVEHGKRLGYGAVAVFYLALAYQAFDVVTSEGSADSGSGGSGSSTSEAATSTLLDSGVGQLVILVAAVVLVAVAGRFVHQGLTRDFVEDELDQAGLSGGRRRAIRWLGVFGHLARGVAFAAIAWFLIDAVVGYDPEKAGGLDQALTQLRDAAYGPAVLWFVAVGFVSFGVYALLAAPDKTVDEGVG